MNDIIKAIIESMEQSKLEYEMKGEMTYGDTLDLIKSNPDVIVPLISNEQHFLDNIDFSYPPHLEILDVLLDQYEQEEELMSEARVMGMLYFHLCYRRSLNK